MNAASPILIKGLLPPSSDSEGLAEGRSLVQATANSCCPLGEIQTNLYQVFPELTSLCG